MCIKLNRWTRRNLILHYLKGTVTFCMFTQRIEFIRRSLNDVNILLSFGAKRYTVRSWILRCVLYTNWFLVRIIHTIIGTLWVRNVISRGFLLCIHTDLGFPKDNAKERGTFLYKMCTKLNKIRISTVQHLLNLHYFILSCSYKIFFKLFKTNFTSVYIRALWFI